MAKKVSDKKGKLNLKLKRKYLLIITALTVIAATLGVVLMFFAFFYSKVYPGVYINGVHVGGLSQEKAREKLSSRFVSPEEVLVTINSRPQIEINLPLSSFEAKANYDKTISEAYSLGRSGRKTEDIKTVLGQFLNPINIDFIYDYNEEKLIEQVNLIHAQSPSTPIAPSLALSSGEIAFVPGAAGTTIDTENIKALIIRSIRKGARVVSYTPQIEDPTLTPSERNNYISRGEKLLEKTLVLNSDSNSFSYTGQNLLSLLRPKGGYSFETTTPTVSEIAEAVKSPPTNPVFTFAEGRVQEFSPAKDGLEVEPIALEEKMVAALSELENTDIDEVAIDIPVKRSEPDFATEDVNDLGIKELIGVGTSSYKGSISSRVFNVAHAAAKLNGVLIKPGETFSFVNTLGDISTLTGYKQAYVIQNNQTVLGDGGGVCQVSTTFFRAALNAGLPIVERHAHSYRVGYYEQDSDPGIDATIYHPTVDIKIKNDTPGHILIQTFADTQNMTLRFEFYGTSDGRIATIGKPVVSSSVPPPEDLYTDDPNLPTGQVKQIDYKAWGAKAYFDYTVERNGETIIDETFYSNYRPWQAKFLRGTGPAQ
jgi:vancomycin resistance protein YoaR